MNEEKNRQLLHKLTNGGRTNLSKWVKNIVDNFCEEQAINKRASYENISIFFTTISTRAFFAQFRLCCLNFNRQGCSLCCRTKTSTYRTKIQHRKKVSKSVEAICRITIVETIRQVMNPIVDKK